MTLVDALSALPRDHVLISGPSGCRTVGQLLDIADAYGPRVRGCRIALKIADPIEGIESLVVADGQADAITLLPHNLHDQHLSMLFERAGCNVMLCKTGSSAPLKTLINCYSSLQDLTENYVPRDRGTEATVWHLVTSGTSGNPKMVAHTMSTLNRTTKRGGVDVEISSWGLLYDFTRFAGLQVVLQAIFGGIKLIVPAKSQTLRERLATLAAHGCTHLSATPTLWRAIVMTPGANELPLRQITLGGEIADGRILSSLKTLYPNARVTHIYASSEAGVGFSVKDGAPGFPASYLDYPPAGLALRVDHGRLHIKNNGVTPVYVGTDDRFGDAHGWIDTGDNVALVNDRVYFLGRANGVINVGGNKVHPEEVEQLLLAHPMIQAVRVFGKPSSIMGMLVVAEILPELPPPDPAAFRSNIRTYLKSKIDGFKMPAIINLVEQIEFTSSGKIARGVKS